MKKRASILNEFVSSKSCSIHKTFRDYNEQKSTYRFISNKKVTEDLLINKLKTSCSKAVESKDVIVILDTSNINLDTYLGRITDFEGIGILNKNQHQASYGFLLHPLYVVDEKDGSPYGMADVHLFNRPMEGSSLSRAEKKRSHTQKKIEEKESYRWVGPCIAAKETSLSGARKITYVMDREADIWEVYDRLPDERTDIVVRSKENRRIINEQGENIRLRQQLESQQGLGLYTIELKRKKGRKRKIKVELKAGACYIKAPGHKKENRSIAMSYVEVKELSNKKTEKPLHWILWTSRRVETIEEAKNIIEIYTKRWEIEVFFKLLKSDGYQIENCQLETGKSIRKLSLIIMDAAIKVLQLKAARNGETALKVKDVFEDKEINCMKLLNKKLEGNTQKQKNPYNKDHLSWAAWIIARLAGWKDYYGNKNPPGNKTFVNGLEQFDNLMIGYSLKN